MGNNRDVRCSGKIRLFDKGREISFGLATFGGGGGVGDGMPITMGMRCQRLPREVRGVETSTSLPMKFVEIANR